MRAAGEDAFWVTPFEYFDETTPDRVIKVSMDGRLLEGDYEPSPAVEFHAAFYKARPDVNSVIHTHSHYAMVFSTTRRVIGQYNVGSVLFYNEQALYEDDGERPAVEGPVMAEMLGADKSVVLIKNHGAVIVAESLETCTSCRSCSRSARSTTSRPRRSVAPSSPEKGSAARQGRRTTSTSCPNMWEANYRRLRKSDPDLVRVRVVDGVSGRR
jgi:L-fuculose-phosphate aldolase